MPLEEVRIALGSWKHLIDPGYPLSVIALYIAHIEKRMGVDE